MGSLWSSFEQDDAPDPHPRFPLRMRRISRLWSRVSFPSEEGRLRCNSNRSWRMHLEGVCRLPGRMGCRRRRSARLGGCLCLLLVVGSHWPDRSVLKILVRLHGCLEQLLIEQLAECQCCKEDLSCL